MPIKLSQPSKQLATRLLRELDFEERLTGIRVIPMAGDKNVSIYSFRDLIEFLHVDLSYGYAKTSGSIGYMDLTKLIKSIEEVFGDKELAVAIREKVEKDNSYAERVWSIQVLLKERFKQCEEVAAV